jgi:glycosyltransferase involved in cell wall biosynthesis
LKASVVIPTYNRADLLRQTISSIVDGSPDTDDYEIIVSDDGSTDGSFDKAFRQFEGRVQLKYVYMPDEGFRVARARNLGASVACGEVLIFCDSGVLALPGFVSAHIELHRDLSRLRYMIGYVYGIYSTDDGLKRLAALLGARLGAASQIAALDAISDAVARDPEWEDPREIAYRYCQNDLQRLIAPWALTWTANVSLLRSTFTAAGGFDENYKSWGAEDMDFGLALHQRGVEIDAGRTARAVHIPHDQAEDRFRSDDRNKEYLHAKYKLWQTARCLHVDPITLNVSGFQPDEA